AGACVAGTPPANGTACGTATGCQAAGSCQTGTCVPGAAAPDGTACEDGDPCTGGETCSAGTCVPHTGPAVLTLRSLKSIGKGNLLVAAPTAPAGPRPPSPPDPGGVPVPPAAGPALAASLTHPASNAHWRHSHPPRSFLYEDPRGQA